MSVTITVTASDNATTIVIADKLPVVLDRSGNAIAERALVYERKDTKWNQVRGGGRA